MPSFKAREAVRLSSCHETIGDAQRDPSQADRTDTNY
jgi:hypothetical protein